MAESCVASYGASSSTTLHTTVASSSGPPLVSRTPAVRRGDIAPRPCVAEAPQQDTSAKHEDDVLLPHLKALSAVCRRKFRRWRQRTGLRAPRAHAGFTQRWGKAARWLVDSGANIAVTERTDPAVVEGTVAATPTDLCTSAGVEHAWRCLIDTPVGRVRGLCVKGPAPRLLPMLLVVMRGSFKWDRATVDAPTGSFGGVTLKFVVQGGCPWLYPLVPPTAATDASLLADTRVNPSEVPLVAVHSALPDHVAVRVPDACATVPEVRKHRLRPSGAERKRRRNAQGRAPVRAPRPGSRLPAEPLPADEDDGPHIGGNHAPQASGPSPRGVADSSNLLHCSPSERSPSPPSPAPPHACPDDDIARRLDFSGCHAGASRAPSPVASLSASDADTILWSDAPPALAPALHILDDDSEVEHLRACAAASRTRRAPKGLRIGKRRALRQEHLPQTLAVPGPLAGFECTEEARIHALQGHVPTDPRCPTCAQAKQQYAGVYRYPDRLRSRHPGDVIIADLCGPWPRGAKDAYYLLVLLDEATGILRATPLHSKIPAPVILAVNEFRKLLCQDAPPRKWRLWEWKTDGGGEFKGHDVTEWLAKTGGTVHRAVPYRHGAQAESAVRTVEHGTRSLLHASGLYLSLWPYAAATFCYNLSALATGVSPDSLLVFGQLGYAKVPANKDERLRPSPSGQPIAFLGYDERVPNRLGVRALFRVDGVIHTSTLFARGIRWVSPVRMAFRRSDIDLAEIHLSCPNFDETPAPALPPPRVSGPSGPLVAPEGEDGAIPVLQTDLAPAAPHLPDRLSEEEDADGIGPNLPRPPNDPPACHPDGDHVILNDHDVPPPRPAIDTFLEPLGPPKSHKRKDTHANSSCKGCRRGNRVHTYAGDCLKAKKLGGDADVSPSLDSPFIRACPGCDDEDDDVVPLSNRHRDDCQRHDPYFQTPSHVEACSLCQGKIARDNAPPVASRRGRSGAANRREARVRNRPPARVRTPSPPGVRRSARLRGLSASASFERPRDTSRHPYDAHAMYDLPAEPAGVSRDYVAWDYDSSRRADAYRAWDMEQLSQMPNAFTTVDPESELKRDPRLFHDDRPPGKPLPDVVRDLLNMRSADEHTHEDVPAAFVTRQCNKFEKSSEPAKAAWKVEMSRLLKHGVWTKPVAASSVKNKDACFVHALGLTSIKYAEMPEEQQKYKARLCARGNWVQDADGGVLQDKSDFWTAIASLTGARLVAQHALIHGNPLQTVDLESAYLQAELTGKPHYIILDGQMIDALPPDWQQEVRAIINKRDCNGRPGIPVFPLRKALYGLRRSGYDWVHAFETVVQQHDWVKSDADPAVYTRQMPGGETVLMAVYVDDVMLSASSADAKLIWGEIRMVFRMDDPEECSRFLGILFNRATLTDGSRTMQLDQREYIDTIAMKARQFYPGFSPGGRAVWTPVADDVRRVGPLASPPTNPEEALTGDYMEEVGPISLGQPIAPLGHEPTKTHRGQERWDNFTRVHCKPRTCLFSPISGYALRSHGAPPCSDLGTTRTTVIVVNGAIADVIVDDWRDESLASKDLGFSWTGWTVFDTACLDVPSLTPKKAVQTMLGMLVWLMRCTRPDIGYAVSVLTACVEKWTTRCDEQLKRLVAYLSTTREEVLEWRVPKSAEWKAFKVVAYSDANLEDPKSQSGHLICLEDATACLPLAWSSKRQALAATSTAASELVAAHQAVVDGLPLVVFWAHETPFILKVDNAAIIRIARRGYSPALAYMSKAMRLRVNFLSHVTDPDARVCRMEYVNTLVNISDIYTKVLDRVRFETLKKLLSMRCIVKHVPIKRVVPCKGTRLPVAPEIVPTDLFGSDAC